VPGLEFSLGSRGTISSPPAADEIITRPVEIWGDSKTERLSFRNSFAVDTPQLCSPENVRMMGEPGQTFAELGIENRIGCDRGEIHDVTMKITNQQGPGLDVE
jgi:hypothetical protein